MDEDEDVDAFVNGNDGSGVGADDGGAPGDGGVDIQLVELILMYGAPFCGKSFYCRKNFPNHVRLSLSEDATLSIHRAVKVVVNHLLAGKNVVIDDTNMNAQTRKSFINPIKAKVPSCAVRAVILSPSGGMIQNRWAATWALAEKTLLNKPVSRSLDEVDDWALHGSPPVKSEGFAEVVEVHFPLYSMVGAFTTKGLLIDCKSFISFKIVNDEITASLRDTAGQILRDWCRVNPMHRIVILIDEASLFPTTIELSNSVSKLSEKLAQCRSLIRDLCKGLCLKLPLYFTCAGYDMDSHSFLKPPNMGLLSWVMYRHKLSLSNSIFVGIAEKADSPVSALPASAGIKSIKSDIFFGNNGWSISSKMRMHTQENSSTSLAFLNSIVQDIGHSDPVDAANMAIDAALEDLEQPCVIEENGSAGISNFVIVYPPNAQPPPPVASPPSTSPTKLPTPSTPQSKINVGTPTKSPQITKSQIQTWIPDRNSFSNGQAYCSKNMILNFSAEQTNANITKLVCKCRGTQPTPYDVWVEIDVETSPTITSSFCSCPAGEYSSGKCKHVAALLLFSLPEGRYDKQTTDVLPSSNIKSSPGARILSTPSSSSTPVAPSPRRALPSWMESPYKPKSETPSSSKKRKNDDEDKKDGNEDSAKQRKTKNEPTNKSSKTPVSAKTMEIKKLNPFFEDSSKSTSKKNLNENNDRPLDSNDTIIPKKLNYDVDEWDVPEPKSPKLTKSTKPKPATTPTTTKTTTTTTTPTTKTLTTTTTTPASPNVASDEADELFFAKLIPKPSSTPAHTTAISSNHGSDSDNSTTSTSTAPDFTSDDSSSKPPTDPVDLPIKSPTDSLTNSTTNSPVKPPAGTTPKKVVSLKDFLKVKSGHLK